MSLKLALAAVLRALRAAKGLKQEELADAVSADYLSTLEKGAATPTLDKLHALSAALGVSPTALMALTQGVEANEPPSAMLERAQQEILELHRHGITDLLQAQIVAGELIKRPAGKRFDETKLKNVLACKAEGLTQTQTAKRLGMSTSTVHDLWRRTPDAD
ncbi:helix-turn-helix domain-containing protein [Pseudomonas sp. S37]|uniref:helix-turn-helix domain-containing protein n=1 Tax=unclassified Pseudomonas TaxID=196821 RepID=UPI001914BE5F|nr:MULTISPECIES: helix-turn-helix domain-containing protein [unclassified Pseudomonas]MBK4987701.1 helix-turn-helix domain-containing protein [Pseudomonas sp. S36]MBK4991851.1 helix-turn-helix domain-containing protein [Pseudomonas sp. S37]